MKMRMNSELVTIKNGRRAHGVTHHGATFNAAPHQEEAIAKLTVMVEKLYETLVQ
jgi:hypothetical protein